MHGCKTCWYNITDYDEKDKAYHYCHITMKTLTKNKEECKNYKPKSQREYTERQFKRIMENLSKAEWIVEHWLETINDGEYEELYALLSDCRNRIEGITKYSKELRGLGGLK